MIAVNKMESKPDVVNVVEHHTHVPIKKMFENFVDKRRAYNKPTIKLLDGDINKAFTEKDYFRVESHESLMIGGRKATRDLTFCWSIGIPDPNIVADVFYILHNHRHISEKQMIAYMERKSKAVGAVYNFVRTWEPVSKFALSGHFNFADTARQTMLMDFTQEFCYMSGYDVYGEDPVKRTVDVEITFNYSGYSLQTKTDITFKVGHKDETNS